MSKVSRLVPIATRGGDQAPSSWWGRRLEQGRRDWTMVIQGLRGVRPPPFTEHSRARHRSAAERPSLGLRALEVVEVVRETNDAVTLHLADPAGAAIPFEAGQFLTLVLTIDGKEVRRAYSLCTDPAVTTRVAITSKRVAGGLVSNHLNDRVRKGDVVKVLGPSGSFVVPTQASERLLLLAGGSGITPLLSILRRQLATSDRRLYLVFGNRGIGDVIFQRAIDELAARHPGRLRVVHVLSDPPPGWDGRVGVLDDEVLGAALDELGLDAATDTFVCGPAPMMEAAHRVLTARGVAAERIHEERFLSPHLRTGDVPRPTSPVPVTLRIGGVLRDVTVSPDQTLLEAGLAGGVKMPYSCAMGGCGACRVRLERGRVEMEEPNCLSDAERREGYVLTCVGRPSEPSVVEVSA